MKSQEIVRIRECLAQLVGAAKIMIFEIMLNKDWQDHEIDEVVERLVHFLKYPWSGLELGDTGREIAEKLFEEMKSLACVPDVHMHRRAWEIARKALSQFLEIKG